MYLWRICRWKHWSVPILDLHLRTQWLLYMIYLTCAYCPCWPTVFICKWIVSASVQQMVKWTVHSLNVKPELLGLFIFLISLRNLLVYFLSILASFYVCIRKIWVTATRMLMVSGVIMHLECSTMMQKFSSSLSMVLRTNSKKNLTAKDLITRHGNSKL